MLWYKYTCFQPQLNFNIAWASQANFLGIRSSGEARVHVQTYHLTVSQCRICLRALLAKAPVGDRQAHSKPE